MPKIEMYTTAVCPYCMRAKELFKRKGFAEIEEIRVDLDAAKRQEMEARAPGARTVPQIFIDGRHIGGCDDLYALEREGKLDALLAT
ncbi:MAG: glutaredoxin 3 [Rhodocyclaceae bacterium]|nr:glutaredoxin 3 [Rhodocyclaceae bacterium]